MKTSKKLLSLLLVLAMVFALGCTAYAADSEGAREHRDHGERRGR